MRHHQAQASFIRVRPSETLLASRKGGKLYNSPSFALSLMGQLVDWETDDFQLPLGLIQRYLFCVQRKAHHVRLLVGMYLFHARQPAELALNAALSTGSENSLVLHTQFKLLNLCHDIVLYTPFGRGKTAQSDFLALPGTGACTADLRCHFTKEPVDQRPRLLRPLS